MVWKNFKKAMSIFKSRNRDQLFFLKVKWLTKLDRKVSWDHKYP